MAPTTGIAPSLFLVAGTIAERTTWRASTRSAVRTFAQPALVERLYGDRTADDLRSARRRFLEAVMVGLSGCLPIFPVERADLHRGEIDAVDAANIKGPAAWIESRANERMDSAMLAEIVLRCLRIELIKRQVVFAREDAKVGVRRGMPERTLS